MLTRAGFVKFKGKLIIEFDFIFISFWIQNKRTTENHKSKLYYSFSNSLLSKFEDSRLKNDEKIWDRRTGLMNSTEHIFFRKRL
jgi:hypothetical protein